MEIDGKIIKESIQKQEKDNANRKKLRLTLSGQQFESWGLPTSYMGPMLLHEELVISSNYFSDIMPELKNMGNLELLDLSENLITSVEPLQGHIKLQNLILNNNRISELSSFKNMPTLKSLVQELTLYPNNSFQSPKLSQNRGQLPFQKIFFFLTFQSLQGNMLKNLQSIDLPLLISIDVSCNEIDRLEGLESLISLEELIITKNMITNIDFLIVMKSTKLRVLDAGFNRLSLGYVEQLCEIIKDIPSLRDLHFIGNEVSMNKMYRLQICAIPHLASLDGLKLKRYARRALQEKQNEDEIDKLIRETRQEYLERIQKERFHKNNVLEMLEIQKQKIEEQFTVYQREMEEDEVHFIKWSGKVKQGLAHKGDKQRLIDVWKRQIVEQEIERNNIAKRTKQKHDEMERNMVNKKLVTTQFNKKLYEISMKKPDLWRELKKTEFENIQKEQQGNEDYESQGNRGGPESRKSMTQSRQAFEDFEEDMQYDNARALTNEVLGNEQRGLAKEENDAAKKISAQLRQKYNIPRENLEDSAFDQYLDLMKRQGHLNAKYEPSLKIDEDSREDEGSSLQEPDRFYQDDDFGGMRLAPRKPGGNIESSRMLENGARVISKEDKDIWAFMYDDQSGYGGF